MITVSSQYGNAGHALGGHGDDEQWQGYAEQGIKGEARPGPDRAGELPVQSVELQIPPQGTEGYSHRQHQHHGVAGPEMAAEQEGQQQGAKQQGILWRDLEQIQPESEQDSGQHGGGQRSRDMPHQAIEPAADAAQGDQQGRDNEGAYGLSQGEVAQAGDQQCGPRGRPGGQYGYAVIKGEADTACSHTDTQRP